MKVSVIIPVYNAEAFVDQAVQSALDQPETAEVLLVEDASTDSSLRICESLSLAHERVKLLRHPDGKNHGAGATRNLGIRNAKQDYIAFLDADDYYLPERFTVARQIFQSDPSVDGVYGAVGKIIADKKGAQQYNIFPQHEFTFTQVVPPEELFFESISREKGVFHTNSIVVKKSLFHRTGPFDEHLRLWQDSAMWIKMAAVGKLLPGDLNHPIAMYRIHANNRIFSSLDQSIAYGERCAETLWDWSIQKGLCRKKRAYIFFMLAGSGLSRHKNRPKIIQGIIKLSSIALHTLKKPSVLLSGEFYARLFGRQLRRLWESF